ncbi:MAG: Hint domain-containing protein [Oscillospiraceae bacterium]
MDYNALNNIAQQQIASSQAGVNNLANGVLPAAYQQNMENSIKSGVQNNMGNMLTDLGNRGVLSSSVTNKGVQGINDSAATAMANSYNQNIGTLSQLYGQQQQGATAGITAGAAAQEAAQHPALNLWTASLGLNGANTGALSAIAGQGTKTVTGNDGGGGLFGNLLGGLATGAGGAWACFTGVTKINTPDGEKNIDRISVGDKVICINIANGKCVDTVETVTQVMKPRYSDVYTIICESDSNAKSYVNTTLTQPFMKADGTFVLAGKIDVGNTKILHDGQPVMVKGIVLSGERKVYDIKLTGENNYYADGFVAKGATNEW